MYGGSVFSPNQASTDVRKLKLRNRSSRPRMTHQAKQLVKGRLASYGFLMTSGERGSDRWLVGALIGGVGVVVGAALPWLETGGVARSIFTLARVASELGLLDRPGRKLAVYSLLGVPLLVPMALILMSLRLRKLAGLVLVVIGVLGVGSGGAGLVFGAGQIGPPVALVGGVVALVASAIGAFRRSPQNQASNPPFVADPA